MGPGSGWRHRPPGVKTVLWMVVILAWTSVAALTPASKPQTSRSSLTSPPTPPPPLRARTGHLAPAVAIPPLPPTPGVRMPRVPHQEVSAFVSWAEAALVNRFEHLEPSIVSKGVQPELGSAAWLMAASLAPTNITHNLSHIALVAEEATKYMAQALELSRDQVRVGGPAMDVRNTSLGRDCPLPQEAPCPPRKFRAFSGHCNNVQRPLWGAANTRYSRFLPAQYEDGVSLPRGSSLPASSTDKNDVEVQPRLPSARAVSLAVHRDQDRPHKHVRAITAVWGELIGFDISHTPRMAGFEGGRLKCCGVHFDDFHPECYPIRIPDGDPVFGPGGNHCQEYVRSAAAPRTGCTLGPREQLNQATSYLDGSVVYGSSLEAANKLRAHKGGRLNVQQVQDGELPPAAASSEACRLDAKHRCFLTGDARTNEHVGVAALHSLLVREHNRVAAGLESLNPHWADETIFQEARRIVAAELQHITYNEFLPLLVGEDALNAYGLRVQDSGYFTGYDIDMNPSLANVVASAALWYVASLIPETMVEYGPNMERIRAVDLGNTFYAPFSLQTAGAVDAVIRGLLVEPAQHPDHHMVSAMTDHLYQTGKTTADGLDLAAQLIQMGRDHGLPPYVDWFTFCNGDLSGDTARSPSRPNSFDDLTDRIDPEALTALKSVYSNVSDIDVLSGALAERPAQGALLGPTLSCLLGRQFHYLRRGDRFWYENDIPPSLLSPTQLASVRRSSLARLICDNSHVSRVQPKAFLGPDPFLNNPEDCNGHVIPSLDFRPWKADRPYALPFTLVNRTLLEDALAQAHRRVDDVHQAEVELWRNRRLADPQSPVAYAYRFARPQKRALDIANTSLLLEFATARFVSGFLEGHLQDAEGGSGVPFGRRNSPADVARLQQLLSALSTVDVSQSLATPRDERCDELSLPCDHSRKYRSYTGWCNNLRRPHQGKSLRAFNRLLLPAYQDGVGLPRGLSVSGRPLPSPRAISANVHPDISHPHTRYSLIVMQMAQLTDHDLTFTPVYAGHVGDGVLNCRACDSATTVHPLCFPIPVPPNDPFYPAVNATTGQPQCLPVTRSTPGQLTLGHREQLNQLTAYLDASFLYGSDVCQSRRLRIFAGGRMNVTRPTAGRGRPLLPQLNDHPECKAPSRVCFNAGDARSSEQPGLSSIHTLWLREHNRIAGKLETLNPHWTDEMLFQEARRIVTAEFQHIEIREFLPRVIGSAAIEKNGLRLESDGYYHGYDPSCDATIVNEFSSAAFRFGHSLLRPHFVRMDPNYQPIDPPVRLRDHFFNSDIVLRPGMVDELIRGLVSTPMETLDQFITTEVTNHLFEDKKIPFSGFDLAAINIQRARDHGIPPYNEFRPLCNLTRARTWSDLETEIAPSVIARLKQLYETVDDVDLFPGGLSETPVPGGVIGPTFACIIGEQFGRLRRCDRFWYETADPMLRFTETQLAEIRQTTLSRLICDNIDRVPRIQRSSFDLPDPFLNPRVSCANLPSVDLEQWRERQSCRAADKDIPLGTSDKISPCVQCSCTREGPMCQSLRVPNCLALADAPDLGAVLADGVCRVQCAFLLQSLPAMNAGLLAENAAMESFGDADGADAGESLQPLR